MLSHLPNGLAQQCYFYPLHFHTAHPKLLKHALKKISSCNDNRNIQDPITSLALIFTTPTSHGILAGAIHKLVLCYQFALKHLLKEHSE